MIALCIHLFTVHVMIKLYGRIPLILGLKYIRDRRVQSAREICAISFICRLVPVHNIAAQIQRC